MFIKFTYLVLLCVLGFALGNFDESTPPEPSKGTVARYYNPNFGYEPYWPGGDWMVATTTTKPNEKTTPVPMVCGHPCNEIYRHIGKVCGRDVDNQHVKGCNSWDYCYGDPPDDLSKGYKTFDTYCEFLERQCHSAKKTNKPPTHKWILVHMGACVNDQDKYFKPMKDKAPKVRMLQYLEAQEKTFKNLSEEWIKEPC